VLLFLVTVLSSITYFHFTNRRPAIAFLLAVYTPFQNVILPIIFAWTTLPNPVGVVLITLKDSLLLCGLLFCIVNVNRLSVLRTDVLGLLFVAFLFVNSILSESDLGASLRALRSFSIPVALYAFGRLGLVSIPQIHSFVKLLFGVSIIVMMLAVVDYILVVTGGGTIMPSRLEYFAKFYGLRGAEELSQYASGFLGYVPKLIGPFGNNLIMAAFLRSIICIFVFHLVQTKRKINYTHAVFLAALFVTSALTLSRFAIASLFVIAFLVLIQRKLWNKAGKAFAVLGLVIATAFAWGTLSDVVTSTLNIGDESTYTHIDSLIELRSTRLTLFGQGLGINADSQGVTRALEGEGYIRQFIPEIGIFGVALFLSFAVSAVFTLIRFKDLFASNLGSLPARFWIALPLILEILHTPIDTGIQSFLGNGLTWLLIGMVITSEEQNIHARDQRPIDIVRA